MRDCRDETAPVDPPRPAPRRSKIGRFLAVFALALGAIAASGIFERKRDDAALAQWTDAQAVPSVDLVRPRQATEGDHLELPATIEAFYTARIHARVNGYAKAWYDDIGAHVKAGQVLARIETPELDERYEEAKGEFAKAQADYKLAAVTAGRWLSLRGSQAVSQQAADEKAGDAAARQAQVVAAQAHVDQLRAMEAFKDIVAPFDGTVTARHIDVGALVSPINASDQASLFDVSATSRVRVYVSVPQIFAATMHKGTPVSLTLPQYPGRTFKGQLETTSQAISQTSRALLVEAVFDNRDDSLSPGSYAQALFDLPIDPKRLSIPAGAMIFRDTAPEVAIVERGKVRMAPVQVLVDTGTSLVVTGLKQSDEIVLNPSDAIANGDTVHVATVNGGAPDDRVAVDQTPAQQTAAE